MMETRQIVSLWKQQQPGTPGVPGVIVTLVHTEGSSYRRPGARLLLLASGETAGTISGGCLEAEVVRKAFWKVRNGAIVETYSTLFDDTAEIPYGLGCGGTVKLLLEPSTTPEASALLTALEASLRGHASEIETWLPLDGRPLQRRVRDKKMPWNLPANPAQAKRNTARPLNLRNVSSSSEQAKMRVRLSRSPLCSAGASSSPKEEPIS